MTFRDLAAYCDSNKYCGINKGSQGTVDYDEYYIETSIDWIKKVTYAEKSEEKMIESKQTWKLDTDVGIMWVGVYHGVPFEVISKGKRYRFEDVVFDSVKDEDVTPS